VRIGKLLLFSRRALSLRLHGTVTEVYASDRGSPRHEREEANHGRLSDS
jgi:hypothetical protein